MKLNQFDKDFYKPIVDAIGDSSFVYVRNFGNYGDSLIREGALRLFDDNNFDYVYLQDKESDIFERLEEFRGNEKYKTFVFGGGGAWIEVYFKRMIAVIEKALDIFDHVIILPSTHKKHQDFDDFLARIDRNKITFFRRDDHISKEALEEAILVPDTALYIDELDLAPGDKYDKGYFFRVDLESTNKIELPESNFNLSGEGNDMTDVTPFFAHLNDYKELYTDRLHVCIAGYLLGKKVYFYNNSYDKNKSLYLTFFKDKENIEFFDLKENEDKIKFL